METSQKGGCGHPNAMLCYGYFFITFEIDVKARGARTPKVFLLILNFELSLNLLELNKRVGIK